MIAHSTPCAARAVLVGIPVQVIVIPRSGAFSLQTNDPIYSSSSEHFAEQAEVLFAAVRQS